MKTSDRAARGFGWMMLAGCVLVVVVAAVIYQNIGGADPDAPTAHELNDPANQSTTDRVPGQ